jgi:hypothetical protein
MILLYKEQIFCIIDDLLIFLLIFTHDNIYIWNNMKPARPWMLANLKIIWQFHAHPVHQKVWRFFGPRYIGDDFF